MSNALIAFLCQLVVVSTACAETLQAPNVVRLEARTPHTGFNRLLVSITICVPGATPCVTIDDVMVDTGSTGLRLESSAVPASLRLPAFLGPGGRPLGECVRFVHDSAWGRLFRADVRIGGMVAADLPIQIIDTVNGPHPGSCSSSGATATSNGTLGIGPALADCDGACAQSAAYPTVFTCRDAECTPLQGDVAPAFRLPNPVSFFPVHNNGVVFDLPAAPVGGADVVMGTLTFGVGTADNNRLGDARILRLDKDRRFTTIYDRRSYPDSYIDSGTETYIVPDDHLPRCDGLSWAFCARPDIAIRATMVGRDGGSIAAPFRIGDYRDLQSRHVGAADGFAVAAPSFASAFVWGAPFFFGRRVFVLMQDRSVPGADGVVGPAYGIR